MEIRKYTGHSTFSFEGKSRFIQRCWNFSLRKGENTPSNLNASGEEIHVILQGEGRITIGEASSPIREGEMVFVPPRVPHFIENPESPRLEGITLEADWELPAMESAKAAGAVGQQALRETVRSIDTIVQNLPPALSAAEAIQIIVKLFDIGGCLSEQIDAAMGLDNEEGVLALTRIEKKLMDAVAAVADHYRYGNGGLFPNRLKK